MVCIGFEEEYFVFPEGMTAHVCLEVTSADDATRRPINVRVSCDGSKGQHSCCHNTIVHADIARQVSSGCLAYSGDLCNYTNEHSLSINSLNFTVEPPQNERTNRLVLC